MLLSVLCVCLFVEFCIKLRAATTATATSSYRGIGNHYSVLCIIIYVTIVPH